MKCHLTIAAEPLQTMGNEVGLCEAEIPQAQSVMEVNGEIGDLRKLVETYRGLCGKCRRRFLERPADPRGREWIYFLAEGQESLEVEG